MTRSWPALWGKLQSAAGFSRLSGVTNGIHVPREYSPAAPPVQLLRGLHAFLALTV